MHTDPHDDGFERPGRLPHEIEQGLADASHVDNAARPDDPTDDAAHEHRVELDAPVTRPDLDARPTWRSPLAGKCIECGHAGATHNESGYCQARTKRWGECICESGWTVGDECERRAHLATALAAEQARADQAAAKVTAVEALRDKWLRDGEQPDLWIALNRALSATPTAEQGTTS